MSGESSRTGSISFSFGIRYGRSFLSSSNLSFGCRPMRPCASSLAVLRP